MARDREPRAPKKKFCKLCLEKVPHVDYKDDKRLTRFVTDRGKIVARGGNHFSAAQLACMILAR